MNTAWIRLVEGAVERLKPWADSFGAYSKTAFDAQKAESILLELADRLKGNYPFFHPVYAGQMLKPPAEIAQAAYALAMTINPNNHALDGGPPSSEMEKEVVQDLAKMLHFGETPLGHLTSGGSVANLEALWIARCLHPEKAVAFSAAAHYTHERMAGLLGLKTIKIPVSADGKMDLSVLQSRVSEIGTVVVTMGTTGLGLVEPLQEIAPICEAHGIRIHVDAAYGGFFSLLKDSGSIDAHPWKSLSKADSIVIDPHKHGLQPYGCGCVLFKDATVGRFYKHDSPYTYFSSDELHLGEISIECSRAGAAAAALWATLKLFPLSPAGLGAVLQDCRDAALAFSSKVERSGRFKMVMQPELDIAVYFPIPSDGSKKTSAIGALSSRIFHASMQDSTQPLFLSLYKIDAAIFSKRHPEFEIDSDYVTVLRSVFMKPEQVHWVDEIIRRLDVHYAG